MAAGVDVSCTYSEGAWVEELAAPVYKAAAQGVRDVL
jgi:hypothetical protein